MTSTVVCGICYHDIIIRDARQWCTNCEEGLCEDCEIVHRSTENTRTHKIISIIDYQHLKDVLNSEKNIRDIKSSAEEFDKQEENIKKYIQEMREILNKHLNDMEQNLISDFLEKSGSCKIAYANTTKQLISKNDKLAKLKNETESLKRITSDEQIFLGTRRIYKVVEQEINSMKTIFNAAKSYEINLELDSDIFQHF
ncbi:unnamed protein product [Mytilus edulis]|uniref:B box-type domain-containing protein n=1 Tax=Mytilus edulis TaxID=6550 RepID=A0A8S3PZM2_MYTED|nr:unnamed protein product [Mytilus edulis]